MLQVGYKAITYVLLTNITFLYFVDDVDESQLQQLSFIYVGRLEVEKCPGVLIRAIALIASCIRVNNSKYDVDAKIKQTNSCYKINHCTDNNIDSKFCSKYSLLQIENFMKYSQVHFYGEGPLKLDLIKLAALFHILNETHIQNGSHINTSDMKSGMTGIVSFHAHEPNRTKLAHIMHKADYLVNPRLTGETFGFIHIESLFMLTPVIAFNMGANKESILSHYESYLNDQDSRSSVLINEISVHSLAEALMIALIRKQKYRNSSTNTATYDHICSKRHEILSKLTLERHVTDLYDALAYLK